MTLLLNSTIYLTLNPLYHSLIVLSSYRVCVFKKSMSSLDNLSLLPKHPMLPRAAPHLKRIYTLNFFEVKGIFLPVRRKRIKEMH